MNGSRENSYKCEKSISDIVNTCTQETFLALKKSVFFIFFICRVNHGLDVDLKSHWEFNFVEWMN